MNRAFSAASLRALIVTITVLLVACVATGCSEKKDPTDPEDAYLIFRDALFQGDAESVWERLAPSSQQYFQEQYERLVEMDEMIHKYLPQTDHQLARKQAGSILTDDVEDGAGLFEKLFKPESVPDEEKYRLGSEVEEIALSEDETSAKIKTLGGQEYLLTRGDDEEWYVMLVRSNDAVEQRLKWLDDNQSALKQTVEDLIEEERKEREEIIAKLMDVE